MRALKRHPIPMQAFFEYSLVLTYAFPEALLKPLLPPGLMLDTYNGHGFLAIALVQTREMRPVGFPRFLGRNFFLSGYRIFSRYTRPSGQTLRGLRILRSDTDSPILAHVGNRLTHYNYRLCEVLSTRNAGGLTLSIQTPNHEADLELHANVREPAAALPADSPFPDWQTARRYAGPLPFTFDYEAETHSIVMIEGVRSHWTPQPVTVDIRQATFFQRTPFAGVPLQLANAFYIENIPYQWRRGMVEKLP